MVFRIQGETTSIWSLKNSSFSRVDSRYRREIFPMLILKVGKLSPLGILEQLTSPITISTILTLCLTESNICELSLLLLSFIRPFVIAIFSHNLLFLVILLFLCISPLFSIMFFFFYNFLLAYLLFFLILI